MKVYERLARAFVEEGVSNVFGMMGDANLHWIEALNRLGVRILEVRHEGVACGMADGWARLSRTPGVCTTTCGPGVSQLATALLTASRANSPLVAFVGESPAADTEFHQRLDQERFAAACETAFIRVTSPSTVDDAVREAFYTARAESRPVMLSAPMDVQRGHVDEDEPYIPAPAAENLRGQAVRPDNEYLRRAVQIISGSQNPVIVVGQGAMWSGAGEQVLKLARRIGALIVTTLRAKGWLHEDAFHAGISGHYATRTAINLFEKADCVIAVGAGLNRFTMLGNLLYPNARIIHVDCKPIVMMAGRRLADCYIQSDARAGVEALEAMLAEQSFHSVGYRTSEVRALLVNHQADPAEYAIEDGRVDPREVCLVVDEAVPASVPLAIGSGVSASGFAAMLCNRPRSVVLNGHYFGCIGQMFPTAMGMVAATGNNPVVLIDGDASTMMHLNDFDTAVRYEMPLLIVVMNDQALGAEYHRMCAHGMDSSLATIPTPNLGDVAQAFGGKGRLACNIAQVRAAVAEWVERPGPMIIDVRISRNVLTIPFRRTLYASDE